MVLVCECSALTRTKREQMRANGEKHRTHVLKTECPRACVMRVCVCVHVVRLTKMPPREDGPLKTCFSLTVRSRCLYIFIQNLLTAALLTPPMLHLRYAPEKFPLEWSWFTRSVVVVVVLTVCCLRWQMAKRARALATIRMEERV